MTAPTLAQVQAAHTIAHNARETVKALRDDLDKALAAARAFRDPDLTPEAAARKRDELEATARTRLAPRIAQAKQKIADAATTLTAWANTHRPGVDWSDPASIQRAQVKWDQARMRLEAGISIRDLVATADIDTLAALREWAPAWLEAKAGPGTRHLGDPYQAPNHDSLLRAIDTRLVETAGGRFANAHASATMGQANSAYVTPILTQLESDAAGIRTGGGMLGAIIAGHYAEQETRTGLPDAESDAEGGQDAA